MIKVEINSNGFEVNTSGIEICVKRVLMERGEDEVYVSVAVVSGVEMKKLVEQYYSEDGEEHPVLSFSNREEDSITRQSRFQNDNETRLEDLGEIILNHDYSGGRELLHWAEHGTLHLVGVHHD
jgi:ssRNA-specific RNase YbeY (16S rRNA maturation enzyme)